MKANIVFLDADTIGDVSNLQQFSELGKFTCYGITSLEQRIERIRDQHVIVTNKVVIDREIMDACPGIRMICIAATGMNNVDLEYAELKGIRVRNVAGYSTESVAQSTFSMLFYLLHNSRYYDEYVKSGKYCKSTVFTHHGREFHEIHGMRFGIIGLGTIGKRVAQLAETFGAKPCYYSTSGKNPDKQYERLTLEDLLHNCDIISVHCPLNERTLNLITYRELQKMKQSAYILNLGRGGIINEEDLCKALEEDLIAGAATDVLTAEPISKENPLLGCTKPWKLLITPHIAWASLESRTKLIDMILRNIKEFLQNDDM